MSGDIDVSWMPYDLSHVNREIVNDVSKDVKDFKRKGSTAPKASIMYSAIKHDILRYDWVYLFDF